MLSEMICRGAGDLDARAHSDALDQLGVQRDTDIYTTHMSVGATMIGTKLPDALPLLADMLRSPRLEDDALEPCRDLCLQAIDALDDEPQQKVFVQLRGLHFADPFGRSLFGLREDLEAMSMADVRDFHQKAVVGEGMIIGVAGCFDWPQLRDQVGELLGDMSGSAEHPVPGNSTNYGYTHEKADTAQVHIGVAYDALPETDPDSILQRTATAVLSGGMSGRLFTEVREKRGLCYSVYASYGASKYMGVMLGYAGTTTARAQETFDVLIAELRRLSDGVSESEFQRAQVGMKSRLVMQGESTNARAYAIASDQYIYGQPRTLDVRIDEIDKVTLDQLNSFVHDHPPGEMTVVTLGPEPLSTDSL
jgi:predicted Zn-dependent peptidase